MITAIDTSVIAALWDEGPDLSFDAQSALDTALKGGGLVISGPVFAELLACPGRDKAFLDVFLNDTGINVDWDLNESISRAAGCAFQAWALRRRRHRDSGPRGMPADFV